MRWLGEIAKMIYSLLGWYRSGSERRKLRKREKRDQSLREAVHDGDADSVSRRIDELRRKKTNIS